MRVVVIGAGVGGLTTAALLAKAGLEVTVLEGHTYPGGLAGTFFHRGYRFDAGATLLAGFAPGGVFDRLERRLGVRFPVQRLPQGAGLMQVWLPGGERVERPVGRGYELEAQLAAFGPPVRPFWQWQERRAEALWSLAEGFPFPPVDAREFLELLRRGVPWAQKHRWDLPGILADAVRRTAFYAPPRPAFRRFLDAQLLIASQADAGATYALFGAAALDLPHRGVAVPLGGMGVVAETLARAVEAYGGRVLYRHRVDRLIVRGGRVEAVEVRLGGRRRGQREVLEADLFVANLTPADLAGLMGRPASPPSDGWGAFVLHAVLPDSDLPPGPPYRQWAGEGDWVFVSLAEGAQRGGEGVWVLSASVHTPLSDWRGLGREEYQARKESWQERVERGVERIIPGFRESARFILGASPRTFAFYTSRRDGWVGGYPQTHPLRTSSPKTPYPNLLRVGEAVFPGQSVPAVAMGGIRVAEGILARLETPSRRGLYGDL